MAGHQQDGVARRLLRTARIKAVRTGPACAHRPIGSGSAGNAAGAAVLEVNPVGRLLERPRRQSDQQRLVIGLPSLGNQITCATFRRSISSLTD
jgi:hypothetical protein